eukprot:IDg1202t1
MPSILWVRYLELPASRKLHQRMFKSSSMPQSQLHFMTSPNVYVPPWHLKGGLLIKFLEGKVEPLIFRERIKMKRSTWSKRDKGDIGIFQTQLSALSVDVAQNEIARSRILGPKRSRDNNCDQDRRKSKKISKKEEPKKKDTDVSDRSKKGGHKKKEWSDPCLNSNFDKVHRLKDCTDTSPEMKKNVFDEHYQKLKSAKAVKANTSDSLHALPDAEEGRYLVSIEEKVHAIALGDYGADFSALDAATFKAVTEAEPSLPYEKLDNPLELKEAFNTDESANFTASKSVKLSIPLTLPGSLILCTWKSSDQVHNKYIDHINIRDPKAAVAKYNGLAYKLRMTTQSTYLTQSAPVLAWTRAVYQNPFADMLQKAEASDVSIRGKARLAKMLLEYRNCFRIKLGPDRPAKVAPLVVTRADNSRPYRSPQRRYAPQQRDFITCTIRELEAVGAIYKNPAARWASP